jgi:hypothetical protein
MTHREVGDVPCGGLPEIADIASVIPEKYWRIIQTTHRVVADTDDLIRNHARMGTLDTIRMDYVTKRISEKQWTNSIFRVQRANERKRVTRQILETFRHLAIERHRALRELIESVTVSQPRRNRMMGTVRTRVFVGKHLRKDVIDACRIFISEMEEIKAFTNKTLSTELTLLGSTKPLQIITHSDGCCVWNKWK